MKTYTGVESSGTMSGHNTTEAAAHHFRDLGVLGVGELEQWDGQELDLQASGQHEIIHFMG